MTIGKQGSEGKNSKKNVDLTNPEATEELTDDELQKVTGGQSRTTLATSPSEATNKLQQSGDNLRTIWGGIDQFNTAGGGVDQLKK